MQPALHYNKLLGGRLYTLSVFLGDAARQVAGEWADSNYCHPVLARDPAHPEQVAWQLISSPIQLSIVIPVKAGI